MRAILRTTLLLLAAFGSANGARAGEPGVTIPPELVLQRFAVNKGGDVLLVPVKIAGKDRLFLVHTGCTRTVVHNTIPLDEPRKLTMAATAGGYAQLKVFGAPDARIGELPLGVDSVVGMDLEGFRESLGHPIDGFLGMDFLSRYVVHVDFDRGELLLLKSVPNNVGEALPVRRNYLALPEVETWISPDQKVDLLIVTGSLGYDSGLLQSLPMRRSDDFQEVGSTWVETGLGTHSCLLFQGKRVSLGSFSVDRPIFHESPHQSLLGLGFLSRFVVTFDFPGNKVYLRKGQAYERPDLRDLSGFRLIQRDGMNLIQSVAKNSPGSAAGFQAGDVLLTFETTRAGETSLFELRKSLCQPGTVECTVRRGTQERRLTLTLPR